MKANDLPPELFEIHRSVNAGLKLWGVSAKDEASVEDLEWCKNTYPHWEQSIILPFICATGEEPIILGTKKRPQEGYIFSFEKLKHYNDSGYELSQKLRQLGYVVFLSNIGGDYLVIDTKSGMEMKISCIYFDDVANNIYDINNIVRTTWTLPTIYQEIFSHPDWLDVWLFKEKKSRSQKGKLSA